MPAILPFRYTGGPADAEALVVDPTTARVFVITKSLLSLGDVYRIDGLGEPRGRHRPSACAPCARRASSTPPTTGGGGHPSGDAAAAAHLHPGLGAAQPRGARSFEDVLDAEPIAVPEAAQPQGEAISYTGDGRGYLLGGEGADSPHLPRAVRDARSPGARPHQPSRPTQRPDDVPEAIDPGPARIRAGGP